MPKSKETDDHNQNSIGNGKLPFQKEVYFSKRKHYFFKLTEGTIGHEIENDEVIHPFCARD